MVCSACGAAAQNAQNHNGRVEILSSRIMVRSTDPHQSRLFYRDVLGLAVYREFGDPEDPGMVFFLGNGLLELSGRALPGGRPTVGIWLQVRDIEVEHRRLAAAGVTIRDAPQRQPWGLVEMTIADPDGLPIVLVEVPPDHPLRRDSRRPSPTRP
jgi:catechol 2,3-dioxygenase-like lactoylglutathione lyase family enzyme